MRLPEEPRLPSITADATDYDKRLSIRLKELFFGLINKANQFETGSQSIKLGSNSDESKNFLISVPSVADGTLVIERGNGTDVLTVDNTGNIRAGSSCNLAGNGPAFSAYQSASPQTTATAASTKAIFDAEEFDTHSSFANSRFTPQIAGYYQVNWAVRVNSSTSTMTEVRANLYKNGVDIRASSYETVPNSSRIQSSGSAFVYMNGTTDYLEVFVVGIGGGTLTLSNALSTTNFSGFLARAA